ncbi:hypothetical protein ERD95_05665 [Enterobacteriaceae bacterium ML5]|nr:hypothetical protein ERD95_05665 [Enterobacteriaceae bacterium ML5]
MRDYQRDPKAMAKTLQEFLSGKNISLKHNEGLDLVSRMLGYSDWNTLSAEISNEQPGLCTTIADQDVSDSESPYSPQDTDKFVGYYKQDTLAPMRIFRKDERFFCKETTQPPVEFFQKSDVTFSSEFSHAQINFVLNSMGEVTGLIINDAGDELCWERIDNNIAEGLISTLERRIKFKQPQAGSERALVNLISGILSGNPNYSEMEPKQALALREQFGMLHTLITEAGALESIKFINVQNDGFDAFHVQHELRKFLWVIGITPESNKIIRAWVNAVE